MALIVCVLAAPLHVRAAEEPVTRAISETEAAALLMQAGRLMEAKAVLAHVLAAVPEDNEAHFLSGMIAIVQEEYDLAIMHFRSILSREPDAERVRLELARAFFLAGDYENAARNFRFARAGDLPPEAVANVDQYLGAISRLKRWTYSLSFAVAQDTNVNAATDLNEIDIFGLPFVLSDDARKKSGYGVSVDAGGEWTPLLFARTKARIGAYVHRTEYSGGDFDDMTVSALAGPEWIFPRTQIAALGTGFTRWFGNESYNTGIGGRILASHALTPQLRAGASMEAQNLTYELAGDQSGPVYSASLRLNYTLSPSSTLQLAAGLGARKAEAAPYSSTTHWFAGGYYRDFPFGFSAYLESNFTWVRYHAPLAGFGETRKDMIWSLRTEILSRRIEYAGFTPKLIFVYAAQTSTIPLYEYGRSQFSIGLTRQF